jgi:hypothetical protein
LDRFIELHRHNKRLLNELREARHACDAAKDDASRAEATRTAADRARVTAEEDLEVARRNILELEDSARNMGHLRDKVNICAPVMEL